ncbi:MAG: methionyl-tRNA formyltransferase [Candidatus Levybacteria bacterium]|nr:methionyl-tRNA formyltransferase [Candidatus Levybacteria bacterium]
MISVVFFGSFQQYSVQILKKLHEHPGFQIVGVVTTPPRKGDRGVLTTTAVHQYAKDNNLPLFPLEDLNTIPNIERPDFIVVAGYGQMINDKWLNLPKVMPINFHPSLLPQYAGRFPIEWAILNGEETIGVTLIKMSAKFDKGDLITQVSQPLLPTDTKESLYTSLYDLGGDLIISTLPEIVSGNIAPLPQSGTGFYARQLTKDDGYIDSKKLSDPEFAPILDKKIRALLPWPGVWTFVFPKNGPKLTMKIFSFTKNNSTLELEKVQIEGKKSTFWSEISSHYSLSK